MDANLIEDVKCKAYFNLPYFYSDICIIYPLTLKDINRIGLINYSSYLSILTMDEYDILQSADKKGIQIDISQIVPFKFILDSAKNNYTFLLELKNAFRTFIREEIVILFDDYSIVIGDGTDKRIINLDNFGEIQNIIRVQNKRAVKEDPPPNESPMHRKFRLKAEFRDAVKRNQKSNDPDAPDFCALLSAFNCYSGASPQEMQEYSFFAFKENFERHQLKDKYSLDIKSILAGADSKKVNPKPWIIKTSN